MTTCGATRDGRVCARPSGHLTQQHRAADGKHWYYSDGEKEAQAHIPLVDLIHITDFQREQRLAADGVVGPRTAAALRAHWHLFSPEQRRRFEREWRPAR